MLGKRKGVKSDFFRILETALAVRETRMTSGESETRSFLDVGNHPAGYKFAQLYIENVAHWDICSSLRTSTVQEIVFQKMLGVLSFLLNGARSTDLRYLFLNSDVAEWTVTQKACTKFTRDERAAATPSNFEQNTEGLGFDERVKSTFRFKPHEKAVHTCAYLFLEANAAMKLNREYQHATGKSQDINVVLEGTTYAVHGAAFGAPLHEMEIRKLPPGCHARVMSYNSHLRKPDVVLGEFSSVVMVFCALYSVFRERGQRDLNA